MSRRPATLLPPVLRSGRAARPSLVEFKLPAGWRFPALRSTTCRPSRESAERRVTAIRFRSHARLPVLLRRAPGARASMRRTKSADRIGDTFAGDIGRRAVHRQLGLSPVSERSLKHDAAKEAEYARWLRLADYKLPCDEETDTIEPDPTAPAHNAPASSTPSTSR